MSSKVHTFIKCDIGTQTERVLVGKWYSYNLLEASFLKYPSRKKLRIYKVKSSEF